MSKITITDLQKMKQDGQKITAITAYDATFAKLFDDEGAQVLVRLGAIQEVLGGLDGGDAAFAQFGGELGHAQVVQCGLGHAGLTRSLWAPGTGRVRRPVRFAGWLRVGWARWPRRRAGAAARPGWRPRGGPGA